MLLSVEQKRYRLGTRAIIYSLVRVLVIIPGTFFDVPNPDHYTAYCGRLCAVSSFTFAVERMPKDVYVDVLSGFHVAPIQACFASSRRVFVGMYALRFGVSVCNPFFVRWQPVVLLFL